MNHDWQAHRQALTEARLWVAQHFDPIHPATSLRSKELGQCLPDYPEEWLYGVFHPQQINDLIEQRRQLLAEAGAAASLRKGRILVVLSDSDTAMGEGTPASKGVIDDAYLPPWDTWFALLPLRQGSYRESVLLAWIPSVLETLVQNAIDVAASQHIEWLDAAPNGAWPVHPTDLTSHEGHLLQIARKELSNPPA
jgi:hypothetical protein